jgi:hypothetical protein
MCSSMKLGHYNPLVCYMVINQGPYSQQSIFFVLVNEPNKLDVFAPGGLFQPSLIFVGEARSYTGAKYLKGGSLW